MGGTDMVTRLLRGESGESPVQSAQATPSEMEAAIHKARKIEWMMLIGGVVSLNYKRVFTYVLVGWLPLMVMVSCSGGASQKPGRVQLQKELKQLEAQLTQYHTEHDDAIAGCNSAINIARDARSSGSGVTSGYWSGFTRGTCRQSGEIIQKMNNTLVRISQIQTQLGNW